MPSGKRRSSISKPRSNTKPEPTRAAEPALEPALEPAPESGSLVVEVTDHWQREAMDAWGRERDAAATRAREMAARAQQVFEDSMLVHAGQLQRLVQALGHDAPEKAYYITDSETHTITVSMTKPAR